MILDTLDQAARYAPLHQDFGKALLFLESLRPSELKPGRREIDGERIFAIVSTDEGRGKQNARLEAHRRYIDIQFVVEGREIIGWKDLIRCGEAVAPYDPERDIIFYRDPAETWLDLRSGCFAIFFPEDAHAPLAGTGPVTKVVLKIQA